MGNKSQLCFANEWLGAQQFLNLHSCLINDKTLIACKYHTLMLVRKMRFDEQSK